MVCRLRMSLGSSRQIPCEAIKVLYDAPAIMLANPIIASIFAARSGMPISRGFLLWVRRFAFW